MTAIQKAREALEQIAQQAEEAQKYYDRYGPTWTTPGGNEYEDTSSHLAKCNELAEIARSALAALDAETEVKVRVREDSNNESNGVE